jgi:hypothetical protein
VLLYDESTERGRPYQVRFKVRGVLRCNVACCVVTWRAAVQRGVLRCNVACCVALQRGVLRCVATWRAALRCNVACCVALHQVRSKVRS